MLRWAPAWLINKTEGELQKRAVALAARVRWSSRVAGMAAISHRDAAGQPAHLRQLVRLVRTCVLLAPLPIALGRAVPRGSGG